MSADLSLAHLFRMAGRCLLVDGSTGALARLTAEEYRAWTRWRDGRAATAGRDFREDPRTASLPHLQMLLDQGFFRAASYPEDPLPPTGLHSLCLNVAHSCNLACKYCFAAQGDYGEGERALMTPETARRAVDFLLARCAPGRTLCVDFFGGEPLLAWDTVIETVRYGKRQARSRGAALEFTMTTNGLGMDAELARFLAAEMSTVIVSLDGRPKVHDRMRPTVRGEPSYDATLAGATLLSEALRDSDAASAQDAGHGGERAGPAATMPAGSGRLWIRGTFTRFNLDFWQDALHLLDRGFDQVSIEPAAGGRDAPWGLRKSDLPQIRSSYLRLVRIASERGLRFFHFELNRDRPACAPKRFGGCGAGISYACVSPSGAVFPCHQFDGMCDYVLGSLAPPEGGFGPALPDRRFAGCHVGSKEACRSCWAQLYCGGGCHHDAVASGGGLYHPSPLTCDLIRLRVEAALAFAAAGPAS